MMLVLMFVMMVFVLVVVMPVIVIVIVMPVIVMVMPVVVLVVMMPVIVIVIMIVMPVIVIVMMVSFALQMHVELGRRNAAAIHARQAQFIPGHTQLRQFCFQKGEIEPQIQQCAKQHVAAGARKTVQI